MNDRGISICAGKMTKEDKRHTPDRLVIYYRKIGHTKQFSRIPAKKKRDPRHGKI